MNTTDLLSSLADLPLYRVRVIGGGPGYRLTDYGRRLASARYDAADINDSCDGLTATVEAYDRHTGATIRVLS